ncbi:MAG: hypothetical protein ACRBBR_01645 [Cellvibrionaceae bacterium]
MGIPDISSTTCAFIPVYCYYDENAGEVKTPILLMDNHNLLLKAIILEIDPNIFTYEELKDQFIEAYYSLSSDSQGGDGHLDSYDIYPQLVTVLHTDSEEISIYICELYENTEDYFKKENKSNVAELISYKEGIDELISGGALDPLTEKILVTLSDEDHLTSTNKSNSIELF